MIGLVRKVVAGPKNKTQWKDKQLDLTYITDRIIAMAFPASGLQKTYRNSIKDVAAYLYQQHENNYYIINISMKKYDYTLFGGRVKDYIWPDHQVPPLTTIFSICKDMYDILKSNSKNVIAVHCNHGKGRTGTSIISFLLYTGYFKLSQQALQFYNTKRFSDDQYTINQPCQHRYLKFIELLLPVKDIPKKLVAYYLDKVEQKGFPKKMSLKIFSSRDKFIKQNKIQVNNLNNSNDNNNDNDNDNDNNNNNNNNNESKNNIYYLQEIKLPIIGDILIELFKDEWKIQKQLGRINFNTYFIEQFKQIQKQFIVLFNSSSIKLKKKKKYSFILNLHFKIYCNCHQLNKLNLQCACYSSRKIQQYHWNNMIQAIENIKNLSHKQKQLLLQIPHSLSQI